MRYCKNCGCEVGKYDRYCTNCGAKIDLSELIIKRVIFLVVLYVIVSCCFYFFPHNNTEKKSNHNKNTEYQTKNTENQYNYSNIRYENDNTENISEYGEDWNVNDLEATYYGYNLIEDKYYGPYNLNQIKNIKNDYYVEVSSPEGTSGSSAITIYDKNFKEIPQISYGEGCIGHYNFINNKLIIDDTGIRKINFSDFPPKCTQINQNDEKKLLLKIINLDYVRNNEVIDVSGYKYYYPKLEECWIPNADRGIRKIVKGTEEFEFYCDAESKIIYITSE